MSLGSMLKFYEGKRVFLNGDWTRTLIVRVDLDDNCVVTMKENSSESSMIVHTLDSIRTFTVPTSEVITTSDLKSKEDECNV